MATTIWLMTLDILIPRISTPITSSAITTAGRSTTPSAADA